MNSQPQKHEIAVVGIACRVPGAEGPEELWRLLTEGRPLQGRAPQGRFELDEVPTGLREQLVHGSYHHDTDRFDAELFGLSARESAAMDPHQRWAMELAWAALEDAGQDPSTPRDTDVGVFVGAMGADWAMEHAAGRRGGIGPITLAATTPSMLAARISHTLGLRGPSLVIDCGQSSSLVAVHHAVLALRAGDCASALVAGLNLNLNTENALATASFGGQSPTGHASLFEDDADGYVRGEGGATVLLRPLHDAVRDGDRVYAVVRGSAVAHDGGGRELGVPEPAGHARTIRRAHAAAGAEAREFGFLELHGTGTPVGDRAEVEALTRVFAPSTTLDGAEVDDTTGTGSGTPLLVGSLKTSVGHLEGAAGLLGLVKAALVAARGVVPGTAGHRGGAPAARLAEAGVTVPVAPTPLPSGSLVGVSSLSMGGTNCHVVLAAPPAVTTTATEPDAGRLPVPILLSTANEESLRATAAALDTWVAERGAELDEPGALAGVARTLTTRRARLTRRAGFTASSADELRSRLAPLAAGRGDRRVHRGHGPRARTAFLFPGQGSQRAGMGAELHALLPAFARRFDEVAALADPLSDVPLRTLVLTPPAPGEPDPLRATHHAQLALFAFGVALADCVQELGVRPDVLLGHSVGELAAAQVAGVFSLPDAVRLVVARGKAMAKADPTGLMLSVRASVEDVKQALSGQEPRVGIAAVNGPRATVLSGDGDAVLSCAGLLRESGFRVKELAVGHAFHSPHMDPVLEEFRATARQIDYHPPSLPVISNLTGAPATGTELRSADYWVEHARRCVRFGAGLDTLRSQATTLHLELGATRTLTGMVLDAEADDSAECVAESLVRENAGGEYASFLDALTLAQAHGHQVRWEALTPLAEGRWTPLPTYRFTGQRHGAKTEQREPRTERGTAGERVATAGFEPMTQVLTAVAEVLGLPSDRPVDPDAVLTDLGMTSVSGLDLRAELVDRTGLELPTSLVYDHPTPRALATHLTSLHDGVVEVPEQAPAARPTDPDTDPVVVAAMACRFPGGVNSPGELWELVLSGQDALGGFPQDRGPAWDVAGDHPRYGGFLDGAAGFDAAFFGISPREARAMDPQQRIALELCWEAWERAGLDPHTLRGQQVGVFLGAMAGDYAAAARESGDVLGGHELTGASGAVLSGRVSYQLGLTGPALTVDTACSSSLVALRLAMRSLTSGECELALAGGVTVMSSPRMFQEFQRLGGLAADGRCKPFSGDADGTVWSEGAGVVVVTRLSEARRRGCPVLAVLRGGAVNQDGASNGLTAPSGVAQRRVIHAALADAGLRPQDVGVVEAHGTGTVLGDSVEAQTLIDTYGNRDERSAPLLLGSLKSVIGHSQAAAGVGGLIKTVLALRHEQVPATLHVGTPTPKVEWPASVRLPVEPTGWPHGAGVRRAAVSSFGMSGTNAHLIVEEPPAQTVDTPDTAAAPGALPYVVSAGSANALRHQLDRLHAALASSDQSPAAVAATLARRRAALPHRVAVVAADLPRLRTGLAAARGGESAPGVAVGEVRGERAVAFVFPGQGSQWTGMAHELLATAPPFADAVRRCDEAFAPHVDFSVSELLAGEAPEGTARTLVGVQVTLFTTMVALAELWRACGVVPDVVLGHSQGEVAAAHVAGALTLEDAAAVVATRAKLLAQLSGTGTMAVLELDAPETRRLLADHASTAGVVEVAAVNGPGSTVVSGPVEAVRTLRQACERAKIRTGEIAVDYASHSAMVEPVHAELVATLGSLTPRPAKVPFLSTARVTWLEGTELDATYWYENLRGEVRFAEAVAALAGSRRTAFLEVSPHEVLTSPITAVLDGLGTDADPTVLGTLRRDQGSRTDFLTSLARAWTRGVPVSWGTEVLGDAGVEQGTAELPPTPFEHQRFWIRPGAAPTVPAAHASTVSAPEVDQPPEATGDAGDVPDAAPAEVVMRKVAEVLQLAPEQTAQALGRSFQELGLDSLTTIDLRRRIREALNVAVPVQTFRTHDTPERLAAWVQDNLPAAAGDRTEQHDRGARR